MRPYKPALWKYIPNGKRHNGCDPLLLQCWHSGTVCDFEEVKRNAMKNAMLFLLGILMVTLSSCELVEGIFKAGVWTGLLLVAVVLGLIIWLISRGRKG
jgi:hypothetical protein